MFPSAIEEGKGVVYSKVQPKMMGITREHIVPVESLYAHLVAKKERGRLSVRYIFNLIKKLEIALITNKENKEFSAVKLNRKMPEGWWDRPLKEREPLDRYRMAGLDDSIWETKFNI